MSLDYPRPPNIARAAARRLVYYRKTDRMKHNTVVQLVLVYVFPQLDSFSVREESDKENPDDLDDVHIFLTALRKK